MSSHRAGFVTRRSRDRSRFVAAPVIAALAGVAVLVGGAVPGAASSQAVISPSALAPALSYVGGKKGAANAKASPVTIGFVLDRAPVTTHPGNLPAAQAAVALINQNLGGIRGRPLRLVSCYIKQTDAEGATCAQQMINSSAVRVVAQSEVKTGEASFLGTMAGAKPVFGVFTNGPGIRAKNTFYSNGAVQAQLSAVPYIAKVLGAKSVAVLGPDIPGVSTALGRFASLFAAQKVSAKVVLYPATATDLIAPIAASGAASSEAVFVVSSTAGACIALAKAFTQLGIDKKPVVSPTPLCLDTAVKEGLGDNPEWHYVFTSRNPLAPYNRSTATATYVQATEAYGKPDLIVNGYAPQTFGVILTIAKFLNELGPAKATSARMAEKLAAFRGPMFLGDPRIQFGQEPYPAIGSVRALIYKYIGNNKFDLTTRGQWLCPPGVASCPDS